MVQNADGFETSSKDLFLSESKDTDAQIGNAAKEYIGDSAIREFLTALYTAYPVQSTGYADHPGTKPMEKMQYLKKSVW